MLDKTQYNAESIKSVSPLEFCRKKPNVYCGSTKTTDQLMVEYVSNSIDEVRLGHGNKIDIEKTEDNLYRIRDFGQGILVNIEKENGKTILEKAFSEINTSGKMSADGVYQGTSLGNFGIGSKLGVFLSHWAEITTFRDGKYEKCSEQ